MNKAILLAKRKRDDEKQSTAHAVHGLIWPYMPK